MFESEPATSSGSWFAGRIPHFDNVLQVRTSGGLFRMILILHLEMIKPGANRDHGLVIVVVHYFYAGRLRELCAPFGDH